MINKKESKLYPVTSFKDWCKLHNIRAVDSMFCWKCNSYIHARPFATKDSRGVEYRCQECGTNSTTTLVAAKERNDN